MIVYYFHEQGMGRYRVWLDDWPHDRFEIVRPAQFKALKDSLANLPTWLGIVLLEYPNDD